MQTLLRQEGNLKDLILPQKHFKDFREIMKKDLTYHIINVVSELFHLLSKQIKEVPSIIKAMLKIVTTKAHKATGLSFENKVQ